LFSFALLAAKVSLIQGPEIKPILPILATTWALADLMTAFLLLSQFYVNGTTFLTALGAAYALSGLLTGPYLLAFPKLFYTGRIPIPEQQTSIWLWSLWHATFPSIVCITAIWDPQLKLRTMSRTASRKRALDHRRRNAHGRRHRDCAGFWRKGGIATSRHQRSFYVCLEKRRRARARDAQFARLRAVAQTR